MKTIWNAPEVEELSINATANGLAPSDDFDDTWVQINGKYYRPGNGKISKYLVLKRKAVPFGMAFFCLYDKNRLFHFFISFLAENVLIYLKILEYIDG